VRRISVLLEKAGQVGNPGRIASGSAVYALYSGLAIAPFVYMLSNLISPVFACVCFVPVVVYFLPELRLRDAASKRKEGVEKELPFFSILVNVLGGAGVPLYSILESLSGGDIFEFMKKEAQLVNRDVTVFGMNPNNSFERLASAHPSRRFSDFLLGYTSKARSGGDLPSYLLGESGALLRKLEDGWTRYVGRVAIVGSTMITVFGVVPLLLMVMGVFSPGFSIVGLVLFCGVGVPLFTVSLLFLIGRMQPVGEDPLRGRAGRSLLLALAGVAVWVPSGQAWMAVASVLLIFFVSYGLSVKEQLRETRETEEGLLRFTKDMMEFKRQEYDLTKAILYIASNHKYNRYFDRLLARVAVSLKAGFPLDEVKVHCRSRLAKLVLFLMGQMASSGGGTVDTVYQVSSYTEKLVEMKRNARAEMRPYLVLSYVSPLLLAFGVTFVGGILDSFSSSVRPSLSNPRFASLQVGALPSALAEVSSLLIVVSSAALGLIGAKITDLTIRSTLRASVNVGIAVGAMATLSALHLHFLLQFRV
jgi:flagellar protein FlaJ